MEGLEKERDFYFGKLRDIEVMCQECEDGNPLIQKILDVLYATEVSVSWPLQKPFPRLMDRFEWFFFACNLTFKTFHPYPVSFIQSKSCDVALLTPNRRSFVACSLALEIEPKTCFDTMNSFNYQFDCLPILYCCLGVTK